MDWKCLICGGEVPYEPEMCCDGRDCGCRGMPIDPPICGDRCWKKWVNANKRGEDKELKPIF